MTPAIMCYENQSVKQDYLQKKFGENNLERKQNRKAG